MKSCRASPARPQSHFWARTRRDQSIAVTRRLPGHGRGDRVCKVQFGHVTRLYSASKRQGTRAQATTWMNHEAVVLRGISRLRRAHGSGLEPSSHRQAAMGVTRPQGPDGRQEAPGALNAEAGVGSRTGRPVAHAPRPGHSGTGSQQPELTVHQPVLRLVTPSDSGPRVGFPGSGSRLPRFTRAFDWGGGRGAGGLGCVESGPARGDPPTRSRGRGPIHPCENFAVN